MENKKTYCSFCQKEMETYEPKFLIPNEGVDIPSSHFFGCEDCKKNYEVRKANETKPSN